MAAIGDSLTAEKGGWLYAAADMAGVTVVKNASVAGSRTETFEARVPGVIAAKPDAVVILGGTNDMGDPAETTAATIGRLRAIGQELQNAGIVPVFATVPPRSDPAFIEPISRLNKDIKRLAERFGVPCINFHAALDDGKGLYVPKLTRDGVHPTPLGQVSMTNAANGVFTSVALGEVLARAE